MMPQFIYLATTERNRNGSGWLTHVAYPNDPNDGGYRFRTRTRLGAIVAAYMHVRRHAKGRYGDLDDVDVRVRHTIPDSTGYAPNV